MEATVNRVATPVIGHFQQSWHCHSAYRLVCGAPRPGRSHEVPPFPELTDRERQILDAVAVGLANTEIGAKLFLSPKTVANNLTTILDKLHLTPGPRRS